MKTVFKSLTGTYLNRKLDLDIQLIKPLGGTQGCCEGLDVDLE